MAQTGENQDQMADDLEKTIAVNSDRTQNEGADDGTLDFDNSNVNHSSQTIDAPTMGAENGQIPFAASTSPTSHIGRFRIQRMLGEGSFGTVYLSHDPQLDRLIALKVAKTGVLVRESDRVRFLREARAAAQLRHPHIVPVYEFGEIDNLYCIAYQYIEGPSLKSKLRSAGRMPRDRAVDIAAKLARGLHYAHTQGIIHRDMKPDNVLIDEQDEPHITDFGCARHDDSATYQTLEGSILGTPAYMSPEQASGHSHQADARSDVWSLGVMLEEMMTGVLPFQGTVTEILIHIRDDEAPALRQVDSSIPKDLETICGKCLAKNPSERFATALELAEELERYQRGEPILSRPISLLARTIRWANRNRAIAALLLAVFVSLIIGTTVSTYLAIQVLREANARALAQVESLRTASSASLPYLIDNVTPFAHEVWKPLESQLDGQIAPAHRRRLHMALLRLSQRPEQIEVYAERVRDDLLVAPADEFLVIRDALSSHAEPFHRDLWQSVQNPAELKSRRFRAACALSLYDVREGDWKKIAGDVTGYLVDENPLAMSYWSAALMPVRQFLRPHLLAEFASENERARQASAAVLAQMFEDDHALLIDLILAAKPAQLALLLPHLNKSQGPIITSLAPICAAANPPQRESELPDFAQASGVANAELTLLALGMPVHLMRRLGSLEFPTIRALEIERLGKVGIDPQVLKQRIGSLTEPADSQCLGSLLLALGQYDTGRLFVSEREELSSQLLDLYVHHPDPYVHSAAEWLLSQWGFEDRINRAAGELPSSSVGHRWYRDALGNTLVVCDPAMFLMGSAAAGRATIDPFPPHRREIPRRFAVATREVTVGEFAKFEADRLQDLKNRRQQADGTPMAEQLDVSIEDFERRRKGRTASQDPQAPITDVTWYEVAAYCRWLGERQSLDDAQQCFPTIDKIEDMYATFTPLLLSPQALDRGGYRPLTSGEWEYVCRAGTTTLRPFGVADFEVSSRYAWMVENANQRLMPVGQLKPNPFGMFDILGNASEWTYDWALPLPPEPDTILDGADHQRGVEREVRGGSFKYLAEELHSAERFGMQPINGDVMVGFRVARTVP